MHCYEAFCDPRTHDTVEQIKRVFGDNYEIILLIYP